MKQQFAWVRSISRDQWRTLFAAKLGWVLDGMDVMLYAFALTAIQQEFGISGGVAGAIASVTLLTSAGGGIAAGMLADRFGRRAVLIGSILCYSLCTGAIATAQSVTALFFWRALVGIGLGAEWSAGSVLVAESWPPAHRGKAIGIMQSGWALGYIAAAVLAAAILPLWGWRPLFAIGALPALFTLWVRRHVPESTIWSQQPDIRSLSVAHRLRLLFEPPLRRTVLLATSMSASLMFAYWGLFTWIPAYLARPLEDGGAGLGIAKSTGWIIPMQLGAFLGYLLFGVLADRFGRRRTFLAFVLGAALVVPLFGGLTRHPSLLLILSPMVGFFGHGYFSIFGALLAELFPSSVRATAQALCYNAGRAFSALAPASIGYVADGFGLGVSLGSTAALFLLGGLLMLKLPETKGRALN